MPHRDIIFGEYLPDRGGDISLPLYLLNAANVRPTKNGYRAAKVQQEITSAGTLGATPISAAGFAATATPRHYAGSATNLYESADEGVNWNTNTRGAGYSSTTYWDFELFGDTVVAVNGVNEPQSKTFSAAVTTDFADLAGSPPIAGRVARIRDHLVLGRLSTNLYALQTSAIGDETDWPTVGSADALAKQSIFQELPRELGPISQLVGGEKFGLAFQQSGITRLTYVGGDVVYQVDTFERSRGTPFRNSVVKVGNLFYYLSRNGVFRTDGYNVQNISEGRVEDAIVKDLLATTEGIDTFGQSVAYDSRFDIVMWPFTAASVNYLLSYHVGADRFTLNGESLTTLNSTLYSVKSLAAEETQVELPYIFNSTPKLMSFSAASGISVLVRTGYIELVPDWLVQITGLQLLGGGNPTSLQLEAKGVNDLMSITTSLASYTAADSSNRSDIWGIRLTARYFSFMCQSSGTSDDLYRGVRIHYQPVSRT